MVDLLPFDPARVSILPIKEATFRGFDQHLIRGLTVGKCVCVKFFISEPGGKQCARLRDKTVLRRNLISTLVQVCGRWLWIESIQPKVVKLLRKDGNRESRSLPVANLQIELAERIKALERCVALQRWQTLDWRANEAIFQRLGEREPVFYQRPSDGGAWRESSNANNVPIAAAGARSKILYGEVKFVEVARTGFYA